MGKKQKENKKEVTIIGFVREIEGSGKSYRVGIASGDDLYQVKLTQEGRDLLYEVGNKVEVTGAVGRTKDGVCRIDVTNYEVYEMDEDDLEEFSIDPDYYSSKKFKPGE